ncbi:MAG: cob(I)yrinic acid a,c-diamide adenosyltransferase [Desulfobacterales bacterium]|jgi:cob(I)alamin adenosyltransferase
MKVYTGGGDRGKTSLFSGERISKDDIRVEAYGDVDELNSLLGAVIAVLPVEDGERIEELRQIQSDLFRIGACLATSGEDPTFAATRDLPPEAARFLEQAIDRMDESLPRLTQFILPGGHPAACWGHVARCVCRRAERHTVRIVRQSSTSPDLYAGTLIYLNRLSDYLFVLARHCNRISDTPDTPWESA